MLQFDHALTVFQSRLVGQESSDRTVENYVSVVRRVHREVNLLGEVALVKARLEQYRAALQRDYAADRISASKIRGELAALRAFYNALVDAGLYPENPARAVRSIGPDPWLPRPMPMSEVTKLFAQITDVQDRAMVGLFLNGLRNVEVCRLMTDWIRYDEAEQTLIVRVLGKGRRLGDVPLNPLTATHLALHLLQRFARDEEATWIAELEQLRAVDRLLRRKLRGQRHPVFTWKGRPLTRRRVNKIFASYRAKAGLSDEFGPHSLRHTTATQLLEGGTDIRVIQEILRHSSVAVTQIYAEVRVGPKARAMRSLPVPGGA